MPTFRAYMARLSAFVWRFRTIALADRVFAGAPAGAQAERRLFGYRISLEVARSNVQRLLWLDGERYIGERELVRGMLAPGMRVVEVGANIGYYLLMVERAVGPGGSITCFEPEPSNLRELRRNVARNSLANVEIVEAAAGREEGSVSILEGINLHIVEGRPADRVVRLVRLDEAVTTAVDFLKIDVDGYEGHVLAGARRLLAEHRPTLFLEVHPWLLPPPYTVDGLLHDLSAHYPPPDLFEAASERTLWEKLAVRYGGRAVRRVPDREALLTDCRQGRRNHTFWAVFRRAPEPAAAAAAAAPGRPAG
jgi:FkbM family methyltransferase